MPGRIEDYSLIGDCETVAPVDPHARSRRRYRDGSLVLDTADGGSAVLTDCMPPRGATSDLVRLVTGKRGRVAFRMELALRFGYGANEPWATPLPDGTGVRATAGPDAAVLRTPVPLAIEDWRATAELEVGPGEAVPFVLAYGPSHRPDPHTAEASCTIAETDALWRVWPARCRPAGAWTEAVRRSAITLKALTYRPTGRIVAAATTSLPEAIGGPRNWDYRFCWLRDAPLTLLALLRAGYREEAVAWRDWLLRAAMGSPSQVHIVYGLAGERRLREWELEWLPGYEGSRPVRVGNAAYGQLRIDVFGELLDALHQGRRRGIDFSQSAWELQRAIMGRLEEVWAEPDRGIWEVRGAPAHFAHSKVMAWAAVDRAVRGVEALGLDGPLDRWRALRRRIHEDVCRDGHDSAIGSFVRAHGSRDLDAGLLLPPAVGFLPPNDRRGACSSACSRCAATSACWPKSTTRRQGACWATFRRHSPTSP